MLLKTTGFALLLLQISLINAQKTDNNSSVSMTSVKFLLDIVKLTEPFSCWCTALSEEVAYCPIKVPNLPIHKGLRVSCGPHSIHCCLGRSVALEHESTVLEKVSDITNEEELSNLMTSFLEILMPQNKNANQNFDGSQGLAWGQDHGSSDTDGLYASKENEYESNHISRGQRYSASSIQRDPEGAIYRIFFNTVKSVIGLLVAPESQQIERSTRNQTFEEKTAALIVGFINSTFFSTNNNNVNRVSEKIDKVDKLNKVDNKLNKVDNKLDKVEGSPGKNSTKTALNKVDPYARLGWFSRAVETAIDSSLYIGSAIGAMYTVSMFLSGLINQVWSTCFLCYFSENFDLVPINTID
ncbi:hypothetical protein SK128_024614 [Halocaridina rubra]|uniref:Uncharacterized protein n=1 Tax=Halocaridina rubra TaxID=373956 RepID=A0AAN8XQT5_HALRR